MVLLEMTVFCLLVGVLFWRWATSKHGHWESKGLPHAKGSFPFGSIGPVFTMRQNIGEFFRQIYRSFPEASAVGYYIFGEPAILLRDPELIKAVLVSQFNSFHDNGFTVNIQTDPLFGINPFVTKGPKWKSIRGIHTPAHTASKIKTMVKDMVEVSQNMTEHIKVHRDLDVEVKELCSYFTLDVVARCGYGFEVNSFKEPGNGFRAFTSGEVLSSSFGPNLATLCADFAPRFPDYFQLRILSKRMEDFFIGMVRQAREHRSQEGQKRADLLQMLLDAKDPQDPGKPAFTEVELAGHCATLFIDGTETSSTALSLLLFRLAKHPDVQRRLRREVDASVPSLQGITYDQIHSLPFLDMVLSETLRLHPPILIVRRVCTKATTLVGRDGRRWEASEGQVITIPALALHTDAAFFPDPETFRPERFAQPDSFPKFAYLPFGEGPRICIGQRFAITQIKIAVIAILKRFHIETKNPDQVPFELDPMSTFTNTRKEGLWVNFVEM